MKTGIIRRIDDIGRIAIPREIRRMMNIKTDDPLELSIDGNKICFELYIPTENYEDRINHIIETLEQDNYLISNKEKVTLALEEAKKALRSANND